MSARLRFVGTSAVVALAALGLLLEPSVTRSCGPDSEEAVFFTDLEPEPPLERFADGELGVIQPTWRQRFLLLAFRRIHGLPLDRATAMRGLNPGSTDSAVTPPWSQRWLEERRAAVPEVTGPTYIYTENTMETTANYVFYESCLNDAFRTAIATLRDRVKTSGGDRSALAEWVRGQDQVFANCRGASDIPGAVPTTAPGWLRQDRAYQSAAALFYANRFAEARTAFEAIERDADSPWSTIAPYLVARTLTRQGTLTAAWGEFHQEQLEEANRIAQRVLDDPRRREFHAAARRLQAFLRFRLHRVERLGELSRAVDSPRVDPDFPLQVKDLTLMLDHFTAEQAESLAKTSGDYQAADWVLAFQRGRSAHALDLWRKTGDQAWLVTAITYAVATEPSAKDLLDAAAELPPASPAFPTVAYHRARLLQEAGRDDEARAWLDRLLSGEARSWPRSAQNLLHARRVRLARNPGDWLVHAQRLPAAMSNYTDGIWAPDVEQGDRPLFDRDAEWILNRVLPLDGFAAMAGRRELAPALRNRLALAGWTKAVLLDRDDATIAAKLSEIVGEAYPPLRSGLAEYRAASDGAARRAAAVWVMLHAPGTSPWIRAGLGRVTPPGERDALRDNWWCKASEDRSATKPGTIEVEGLIENQLYGSDWDRVPDAVVSAAQRAQARAEQARLDSLGPAPDWLCQETLAWADRSPSDPRLPEALALAVRATRYGCSSKSTTAWSRRVFERLHRRFPNSEWTRKTPYWY